MANRISNLMAVEMTVDRCKRSNKKRQMSTSGQIGMPRSGNGALRSQSVSSLPLYSTQSTQKSGSYLPLFNLETTNVPYTVKPKKNGNDVHSIFPFSSNIEEELAIIKGKKIGELSPQLKRLENKILGVSNKEKPSIKAISTEVVTSQSYDSGRAILFENGWQRKAAYLPESKQVVNPWYNQEIFRSLSTAMPANTNHNYDDYTVESFELVEDNSLQVREQTQHENGQTPEMSQVQIAKNKIDEDIDEIEQSNNPVITKVSNNYNHKQGQLPAETSPVDDVADNSKSVLGHKNPNEKNGVDTRAVELALHELEQDLDAVIRKKSNENSSDATVAVPDEKPNASSSSDSMVASSIAPVGEDPHAVFEQMSIGMPYANTFNLGTMDLSATFAAFDKELDEQESLAVTHRQPLQRHAEQHDASSFFDQDSLDHLDVISDIADINQAQSTYKILAAQETIKKQEDEIQKYKNSDASETNKRAGVEGNSSSISSKNQQATVEDEKIVNNTQESIQYNVPILHATDEISPAATAAAMLLAWQYKEKPDISRIKNGEGIWKQYKQSLGSKGIEVLSSWGLTKMEQPLTNNNLANTLQKTGPLLILHNDSVKLITGIKPGETESVVTVIEVGGKGVSIVNEVKQSEITKAQDQRLVAYV